MCLFPFIIFLQDLPAEVGKKLPDAEKIVKLWHELRLSAAQSDKPGGDDRRRIADSCSCFRPAR